MCIRDSSVEDLATKHDIVAMQQRMETNFSRLAGEMKMNRWMLAVVLPVLKTLLS